MVKNHLSRILGEKRITQAELARRTGIRPTTIGDIYKETAEYLKIENIDKICVVLGCTVGEHGVYTRLTYCEKYTAGV